MTSGKRILVTGGAGYIGSHTVLEMLNAGFEVVVLDNLSNSSEESLKRVEKLTGKKVDFFKVDLLDKAAVDGVFDKYTDIAGVIHFAGLKAVGESCAIPLRYYHNNVTGTLLLLESMKAHGVRNFVFSSSATVYGLCEQLPIVETAPLSCTNPYGQTKLMIEEILRDLSKAEKEWNIVILRYFNPTGAHKSGDIGEDPSGIPNNLMPFVAQVAIGKRAELSVFGADYATKDGTGVRDYIHVVDLALGHVAALRKLESAAAGPGLGCVVYNLGTGEGYSVLEMVKAFEKASGREVKHKVVGRRPGDIAACYADPALAKRELQWEAKRGLDEMCEDMWRWQKQNPNGFAAGK